MKTPPTISSPLPSDHRLLRLAGMLGVSKREALGATVEAWAWIQVQAQDGVVPQPVALLDTVTELDGFGEAAVAVGLVGAADGVVVAPAELRQAVARHEERRAYERQKKRNQRAGRSSGTKPPPSVAAAATTPTEHRRPVRLGSVGGMDIMLLWSARNDCYFYKLTGATPDLTGSVTCDDPTLATALKALLDARHSQVQRAKDKGDTVTFSPTIEELVNAARQEQAERKPTPADDAPRVSPECPHDVPVMSPECPRDVPAESLEGVVVSPSVSKDLGAVFDSSNVHAGSPSSSSSSLREEKEKENTTTTRSPTAAEDDFARYLPTDNRRQLDPESAARLQRFADALNTTTEAVREQARRSPDVLAARLAAVGVDSRTGHRLPAPGSTADKGDAHRLANAEPGSNATTSHEDAPGRPPGDETHVQASTKVQPSGGSLDTSVTKPPRTPPSAGDDIEADPSPTRRSQRNARLEDAEQADRRNDILRAVAAFATTAPESVTYG